MRVVALLIAPVVLAGCPTPRKPAPPAAPDERAPATASPTAGTPEIVGTSSDPAKDPLNASGFDLAPRRSVEDAADARKRPFSIEALYRIPRVAAPRWSPDGRRIVFTLTRYDLKAGKSNSDIYLVDADGSGLRRMTHDEASDSSPRWAPDGKSLFFVSTRADESQLWRMAVDGGEAERLTKIHTGVESPEVSSDGKRVAFVSRVFPEHGADDAANKAAAEQMKKSTVQAHMADDLLYRHWTYFEDGQRSHILVLTLADGKIRDATPGDHNSPAFSLGGQGFALAPDGDEVCFASNREEGSARAWTTNKDLFVVSGAGGKTVNLTRANRAFDGEPAYSPDGRYIAFLRQERPGFESDRPRLALYDRKAGTVRLLTERFDSWVIAFRWSRDSRSILVRAAVQGRFPLLRVSVPDGAIQRLAVPTVRDFDVAASGRLAFTSERVDLPLELYTADAQGKQARRLTFFSKPVLEEFDVRPAEELWFEGAAGRKVHTFVVKPHGFRKGRRYPLIVNVHGGPQYQWADGFRGDWQVYPGAGYVVAFFNPHGSIGYGQAYTDAISRDWGGKVYQDVMKVTEALAAQPHVDPARIGAMGWSYGGYMMDWILGHTDRFKALVSMMSLYDLPSFYGATEELWFPEWDLGGAPWSAPEAYRKWSPSTYAARFKTPTLVISGMKDFRVPYTQSLQLFTALRRQDVPARLILLKNDGHWPSYVKSMPLYYAAHLDWFHRYLGGAPSPYDLQKMVRGQVFGEKAEK